MTLLILHVPDNRIEYICHEGLNPNGIHIDRCVKIYQDDMTEWDELSVHGWTRDDFIEENLGISFSVHICMHYIDAGSIVISFDKIRDGIYKFKINEVHCEEDRYNYHTPESRRNQYHQHILMSEIIHLLDNIEEQIPYNP